MEQVPSVGCREGKTCNGCRGQTWWPEGSLGVRGLGAGTVGPHTSCAPQGLACGGWGAPALLGRARCPLGAAAVCEEMWIQKVWVLDAFPCGVICTLVVVSQLWLLFHTWLQTSMKSLFPCSRGLRGLSVAGVPAKMPPWHHKGAPNLVPDGGVVLWAQAGCVAVPSHRLLGEKEGCCCVPGTCL